MWKVVQWTVVPVAIAAVITASTASAFKAPEGGKAKKDGSPKQQDGSGPVQIEEVSPYSLVEQAVPGGPGLEGVVNINTADQDTLQLLPGIGPAKARAIVDFRAKKPFSDPRHLVRVKGIGRETLHRILPFCVVQGPTTLKKAQ